MPMFYDFKTVNYNNSLIQARNFKYDIKNKLQ